MSGVFSIEFSQGSPVLVERTPLPGVLTLDNENGLEEGTTLVARVAGSSDVALASVQAISNAFNQRIAVDGLVVRPSV